MWSWFWLAAGVVLGLVFVSYARDHGPRGEIRVYAVGLVGTGYPIACVPFDLIVADAIVLHMTEVDRKSFARL